MRRSVATTVLFASVAVAAAGMLVGCEDGPNQTYSPATGTLFNNGDNDASANPGQYAYDAGYAGTNALQVCTQDIKRARWAKMLTEDIVPPRMYAGIDMAGGDQWAGETVEQATQPPDPKTNEGGNCQGNPLGNGACASGNGNCGTIYWGDNQEVTFSYNLATHIVDQMLLNLGYTGKMTFQDRTKKHTYVLQIGLPPTKDGATFEINWDTNGGDAEITELFNAAMNTFGPAAAISWPTDTPSCGQDGNCLEYPNDGSGNTIFGFRPLVVYFLGSQHSGLPQPVVSTPTTLYNFYAKLEPYSKAQETLKIDSEGPFAQSTVGDLNKTCTIKIGQTYQDFLDNCINVWDPNGPYASYNKLDYDKLVGGVSHDYENILFNVVGVNQNFSLTPDLSTYQVVQDTDLPKPTDYSTDWFFDVRETTKPTNEFDAAGKNKFIGTGLVEREYARLVQLDIATMTGGKYGTKAYGDPSCLAPASGCTGFEDMVFAGISYPSDAANPITKNMYIRNFRGLTTSLLKPGDPQSIFFDANGQLAYGPFWDNSLQQVVRIMGHGDILSLPPELRDRRYFFRWFGVANIKYMKAYARCGASCTPADIASQPIDMESLFFDNNYLNQFDKFEYIDRSVVQNPPPASQPYLGVPMDYEYGTDVKAGNQRYTNWYRRLDREENAMFTAFNVNKADLPGQENFVNLTNMFGSPVLLNAIDPATGNPAFPSYECAAAKVVNGAYNDPAFPNAAADCGTPSSIMLDANSNSLLDLNGQMAAEDSANAAAYPNAHTLLYYYPGVWGNTIFSKGHSAIQIMQGDLLVEGAHTVIPNFANPWAATSNPKDPNATPINVLVPWVPNQPGNGFPIPYDGTTTKLIQSGELAFEGVLETYHLYYEPWVDIAKQNCATDNQCNAGYTCQAGQCTTTDHTIRIAAIGASDFLGEVFMCQDPLSGDLLHVRMYTSTYTVLQWIANHPGDAAGQIPSAQAACNLVVRWSPYDNYPDYISSLQNGVVVNSNQGQGYGRIVDAELFDVNYENQ